MFFCLCKKIKTKQKQKQSIFSIKQIDSTLKIIISTTKNTLSVNYILNKLINILINILIMFMCICMCSMHACMSACVCACVCVCMCMCMCMCVCMCVCVCVWFVCLVCVVCVRSTNTILQTVFQSASHLDHSFMGGITLQVEALQHDLA